MNSHILITLLRINVKLLLFTVACLCFFISTTFGDILSWLLAIFAAFAWSSIKNIARGTKN